VDPQNHILMSLPIGSTIVAALLSAFVLSGTPESSPHIDVPLGLPPLTEDQQPKPGLVQLGRKLFFDRRLSFNGTNSCAMCHIESQAFASNQSATAVGMEGKSLRRNAPSLFNVTYQKLLFHDGREPYLADQVWSPLLSPIEMANPSVGYLLDKVRSLQDYDGLFEAAFAGHGPSMEAIGDSIASFERTLLSGNSRFDRWYYGGKKDELTKEEKAGFALFSGRAGCTQCHTVGKTSALFTDQHFHVTGVGFYAATAPPPDTWQVQLAPGVIKTVKNSLLNSVSAPRMNDTGRFEITLKSGDRWAYKTPSLRNVERTFPYMHDGSFGTLEEVIEFYNKGGFPRDGESELQPLGLTAAQKASLVAFLKTLTGDTVGGKPPASNSPGE
jgi:cytochrome c peroxidase